MRIWHLLKQLYITTCSISSTYVFKQISVFSHEVWVWASRGYQQLRYPWVTWRFRHWRPINIFHSTWISLERVIMELKARYFCSTFLLEATSNFPSEIWSNSETLYEFYWFDSSAMPDLKCKLGNKLERWRELTFIMRLLYLPFLENEKMERERWKKFYNARKNIFSRLQVQYFHMVKKEGDEDFFFKWELNFFYTLFDFVIL